MMVRDTVRNLAALEDLAEEATNLDIKLKSALTVSGQVKDVGGAPVRGAQISLVIRAGNMSQAMDEAVTHANAEGHYEIKCLPAGGRYIVSVSAKGYGQNQQEVGESDSTNRGEMSPVELKRADQVVAGQVLNGEDKPVAGATVSAGGVGQPNENATTDSQGRFRLGVCAGTVQLSANGLGMFGNQSAEAGDTNVVFQLGLNSNMGSGAKAHKLSGMVTGPDGKPAVHVIGWGQWAMFFQRQLGHAVEQNFDFQQNKWGVPDQAKTFAAQCDETFAALRLSPFYDVLAAALYPDFSRTGMALQLGPGTNPTSLAGIGQPHLTALADSFGLRNAALREATLDLGRRIEAAQDVVRESPYGSQTLKNQLADYMRKRWNGTFALIARPF